MIITRFGDAYASAATLIFSTIQATDDWQTDLPAVVTPVAGAAGAFDFYGEGIWPVSPIVVTKTFTVLGTSYSNIETELNDIRQKTLAKGRSLLWGLWRDGTTRIWTHAKCTSLRTSESYDAGDYIKKTVTASFLCQDGLWYGESEKSDTVTATAELAAGFVLTNDGNEGNYPALAKVTLIPTTAAITRLQLSQDNGALAINGLDWNDTSLTGVGIGNSLIIDSETYSVTNNASAAYQYLSLDTGQVAFFWLRPNWQITAGNDTITGSVTQAGSPATFGTLRFNWYDTYLL